MHTSSAPFRRLRGIDWLCLALALALLAALALASTWLWREGRRPLLLTPAIGMLSDCLAMEPPRKGELEAACTGPQGSAAERIEDALRQIDAPQRSPDGHFEMGYTLLVPLLNLFERDASGAWAIDRTATARIARTVQDVPRPMVLYLFSTHFSERAPIEPELAGDPANIAHTQHGALPVDSFMGEAMYPWSIVRTDNSITQRREQAIAAVLEPLCTLPDEARRRIVGVNLLGEVHHLYPSFESGMGADSDYIISDYSQASVENFRRWLQQRFGTLDALHAYIGGSPFASWDAVQPPARNILRERLEHFRQYLDDAAAGTLAISGWAHDASLRAGQFPWVRVYVDGVLHARVRASAERHDVAEALPDVGNRVGWRHDLHFASLQRGRHRIDVMQEGGDGHLYHMGARFITITGQSQDTVPDIPMQRALPKTLPPGAHIRHSWDTPRDGRAVPHNPLAALWHEFSPHFWQHLDDAAAGTLAISGWAHDASLRAGQQPWVRVYVDGVLHARVRASAVRQDVADALPDVGNRVGWRHDLHFASLQRGRHRIDVMQEGGDGHLHHMGVRFITVIGSGQSTVSGIPMQRALPKTLPPGAHIRHSWDTPRDGHAVFHNPLAVLWHEFRSQQVINYLTHFDRVLAASCLADVPRRTQQIFPARRSGWDSSRFASDASLHPFGQTELGINLYGEPSYGAEFFDWLARFSGQRRYSVTEFHPLRAMNSAEMRATLERHRAHGAHTFSFFLDTPLFEPVAGVLPSPFVLDADNPQNYSDTLFFSLQEVMNGK